ncbi:MAG: lysine--tRNA ligase [Candidatus Taylorbacteria bacterium RIFCSPLOWO2_12_FULL_47_20]|uniref:Lysine--tRNA ligase n=2 Tax=Candidatus Tayloriibacteriota TaxID=1817919 RepID=A0A1G2PC38_9BACT|nr:MAG: lysine--tRNA ligase [Candidatus Taylorbacteria bacterium RIFCSPLOWO2_02_FULL_46_40]OHA45192.1 MAG: lysine--tRNA ligase [Candidatus Taylorbacteria bacterium RIFCSPLOWO2_12_FULL_47_20]
MSHLDELKEARLKKLRILQKEGVDPYPSRVPRDFSIAEILDKFDEFSGGAKKVSLAGRVMSLRPQGGIAFLNFTDGTGVFQALIKEGEIPDKEFDLFIKTVDIGDFISVTGTLFVTKRGEKTIQASGWMMAAKSLLPLPEKRHGLTDPEERYRLRYLDILMQKDLREMFVRKSKFWEVTRNFLKERGFLEVETPTLEITTGGAEARPFITHHNDFDIDLYLRISIGELWQKRLMAAGFTKTFEIGRVYRNEGTSPEHLQEFTNMEFYWAYANARDGMKLVEELYRTIAKEVYGKTKFSAKGHEFDLDDEWQNVDYVSKTKELTGIDVLTASEEEMEKRLSELKIVYTGATKERFVDTLWKYCRKQISGPAFLVGHPVIIAPLSKRDPQAEGRVEMFQPIIAGSEAGRGYSELNDPIDQRRRFEGQQKLIEAGDEEAMMPDWEFVEMLEHGMPPTCGFGFGERVFSFLENKPVRETQFFPLVRPRG